MWGWSRSVVLAVVAVACGGDNLTLPGPGDPATLSIISGDGQRGTVGEAVPQPLVVQLSDGAGRPVVGATVTFQFSDSLPNAAVDPVAPATDTLGQAAASARLGTVPGDQAIEAQVVRAGQDLQVRFRLTAVARPPAGGGDQGGGGGDGGGSAGPPPTGGGGGGNDGGGGGGGGDHGGDQGDEGGGHGHGHGHDDGKDHGKGNGD
jgi:hypothetical protein